MEAVVSFPPKDHVNESPTSPSARYLIIEKLGEGGMGVVYKARDQSLQRVVALKSLPSELTADADSQSRLLEEARAASALCHPNIVAIHDLVEEDGCRFLVMEYVEGRNLAELIPARGLPLRDGLRYGAQIADALAAAHEAGITHRDLKPGNVMLTETGRIKVLDFGLALRATAPQSREPSRTLPETPECVETTIAGTAPYMSPEQAQGLPCDNRSDIFSFGALLYHMLAGVAPFSGPTAVAILGAVVHQEPDPLRPRRPDVPLEVERIVRRCLRKDPARRYQHMGDVKLALEEALEELDAPRASAVRTSGIRRTGWALAGAALAAASLLLWQSRSGSAERVAPPVQLTSLPGHEESPALSPDGAYVVFHRRNPNGQSYGLWLKQVGSATQTRLTSATPEESSPAWSPDGSHIAFLRHYPGRFAVYQTSQTGADERKLCQFDGLARGLSWRPAGGILATSYRRSPSEPWAIAGIYVADCKLTQWTQPSANDAGDTNPSFSPDGDTLAFVRQGLDTWGHIYRLELSAGGDPTGTPEKVVAAGQFVSGIAWTPDGRDLIFSAYRDRRQALWRVRSRPSAATAPVALAPATPPAYEPSIALRADRLVYRHLSRDTNLWLAPGPAVSPALRKPPVRLIASTTLDDSPQFSPDGRRIVFVSERSGSYELWLADSQGSSLTQLTFFGGPHLGSPRWSPDAARIVFDCVKQGNRDLYAIAADGGPPQQLTETPWHEVRPAYSPDGRWVYFASNRSGRWEIWRMPAGGGAPVQLTQHGSGPEVSPSADGRFVYFQKAGQRGLWRIPAEGGAEVQVVQDDVEAAHWALAPGGIVALRHFDQLQPTLEFRHFSSSAWERLVALPEGAIPARGFTTPALTVSPDGARVVYTHLEQDDSDLVMLSPVH